MACVGFLQCTLKVLNFFLTLVGAGVILYSLWALDQWYVHLPPNSGAPGPDAFGPSSVAISSYSSLPVGMEVPFQDMVSDKVGPDSADTFSESQLASSEQQPKEDLIFGRPLFIMAPVNGLSFSLFPKNMPAPWFIYAFLGVGVITCIITITGHIAAEITSACCLSCYTFCLGLLLVVQAAAAAAIFFDKNWYKDIPDDPTGELDKIRDFITDNFDICKWIALAIVIVEVLGLLLAMVLRSVSGAARRAGYDSDDDYLAPRATARQPLLNRQATQTAQAAAASPAENRPTRTDAWSNRMREKYGLDTAEFTYNPESRRFTQPAAPSTEEKKGWCTIM
eukprot:TRINITY_DN4634_c0_g1_i1.p1 TRINITY_DN4634_c0_g1~~TRINITY_DN4634_c0_g1_i1.p1  ORF type:complete len:337 (+),score=63.40 TRINITY_DN4634_c0_g1_i1:210-1220(+)